MKVKIPRIHSLFENEIVLINQANDKAGPYVCHGEIEICAQSTTEFHVSFLNCQVTEMSAECRYYSFILFDITNSIRARKRDLLTQ
jgi:hypothetical protein